MNVREGVEEGGEGEDELGQEITTSRIQLSGQHSLVFIDILPVQFELY